MSEAAEAPRPCVACNLVHGSVNVEINCMRAEVQRLRGVVRELQGTIRAARIGEPGIAR